MRRALRLSLAPLAFLAPACFGEARAGLINFDLDANGNPYAGYAAFNRASPLTDLYASIGVHFVGPSIGSGGAILNQVGVFGVPPRSGNNRLAFNRRTTFPAGGVPTDPESILFDNLVSSVSIWATGGFFAASFRMEAYDASGALVDFTTVDTTARNYSQIGVSHAAGISKVVLMSTGSFIFLYDDLEYTPIASAAPEPGSLALASLGGLTLLGARRLRSRRCSG